MNELHEEIRQTILALNQENAQPIVEELQCHLANLFDMARDELQRRLNGRSWSEPSIVIAKQVEAPYKSVKIDGQIADESKPLTVGEIKAGGWWCDDTSEDALKAFILMGLNDQEYELWDGSYYACFLYEKNSNLLGRGYERHTSGLKQIHRINNDFFWGEK